MVRALLSEKCSRMTMLLKTLKDDLYPLILMVCNSLMSTFKAELIKIAELKEKNDGIFGGDMNSIVEKKDSLNYPEQKMSKCFKKLINIYRMSDCYRQLYPHSKQFSRYYIWKGKEGATRIDRCYAWGNVRVTQAEYLAVSFSDHLAHIVTFDTPTIQCREKSKRKSIYKIKHFLVDDEIFRQNIRTNFQDWLTIKDGLSPTFWWDNVVKPGIKDIALL